MSNKDMFIKNKSWTDCRRRQGICYLPKPLVAYRAICILKFIGRILQAHRRRIAKKNLLEEDQRTDLTCKVAYGGRIKLVLTRTTIKLPNIT